MSFLDEGYAETERERNEGVNYDRVRNGTGGVCASCDHDEADHDIDGECEIRKCGCDHFVRALSVIEPC